jgi:hypothetical protein
MYIHLILRVVKEGFLAGSSIDNVQLARAEGSRQEASIQNQGLAGHEGGGVRANPHDGVGDFLGPSKTADGMEAERKLFRRRRAPETLTHRGFDYRRTHDITRMPFRAVSSRTTEAKRGQ